MNYDYSMRNVDPNGAFVKRVVIYVAILLATIAAALTVLFILFELYLWLILSLGLILVSLVVMYVMGRRPTIFRYVFSGDRLTVSSRNGKEYLFHKKQITIDRQAEKNDYFSKDIVKLSFLFCRMTVQYSDGRNTVPPVSYIVISDGKKYLLAFDNYAYAQWCEV